MKRIIQSVLFLAAVVGVIGFSSCSDEEKPLPLTTSSFNVLTDAPEVSLPVKFENLSLKASSYVWDFGDGDIDSGTVVAPSHTYDDDGNYTVKLRAYNDDGAFTESQKIVKVGRRYLTSAVIYNISMNDSEGNPWDEGGYPDILLLLGPDDAETIDDVLVDYYEDVNNPDDELSQVPVGFNYTGDFELTDEIFFISIDEIDSVLVDDEMEAEFNPMAFVEFNPIRGGRTRDSPLVTVAKFEDGTGLIQIPFTVIQEYQFIIEFEVR